MSVWNTPKTDWVVGEGIPTTFPNNICDDLVTLGRGNGRAEIQTAVASTSAITLPNETDETFSLSSDLGYGGFEYISNVNRQPGNKIYIICSGAANSFQVGTGGTLPPENTSPTITKTGFAYDASPNEVLEFHYDGNYWYLKE